jgi:RNA-directed DNA polymerase
VSRRVATKPDIRWSDVRSGDGIGTKFCVLTQGELSASALCGSCRERKNKMTKGREQSDGRIVPQDRRKAEVTVSQARGGKAITASKQARQLGLFFATVDSPQGDVADVDRGQPLPTSRAVPKALNIKSNVMPTMTMDEVSNVNNLMRAFEKVASNQGAPGVDRKTIDDVKEHIDQLIPVLSFALLNDSYRPGDIRRVWIPKADGGQRGLGIPNVVDRIVQQAVFQILNPHYDPTFHANSHGFRPGRSCHTAIATAKEYVADGYEWVVDLDLEKFFDRVNHDRLLARLSQRITDQRIISLIRQMLKANVVMPDGVVTSTEEGTPQGGPLSPLLSNIVLDELDHELSARGHRFVRYADDCNIYVRSERAGLRVKESISRFIEVKLRLKVNQAKSAVAKPEDRHFLGFRLKINPMTDEVEVLLSKRSKERIDAKIRDLTPRTFGNSLDECIKSVNRYLIGWIGFFRICTTSSRSTFSGLDAHIRRRLRAILLRHWKRKRSIVRRLIYLGVASKTAWRGIYKGRRSWWALSHCQCVDRGLRNAYFAKRGLVSIIDKWSEFLARPVTVLKQPKLPLG